jgi:hypothetical protein
LSRGLPTINPLTLTNSGKPNGICVKTVGILFGVAIFLAYFRKRKCRTLRIRHFQKNLSILEEQIYKISPSFLSFSPTILLIIYAYALKILQLFVFGCMWWWVMVFTHNI